MAASAEFPKANETYVARFGDKGSLRILPIKKLLIVTCIDARIDPAASLGLNEGDAHVVRNAGGIAADALRSIVVSQRLLGTREIALFHHTDCGMLQFNTPQLREIVKSAAPGDEEIAKAVDRIHFLEFGNVEEAVKRDVEWLKAHPLVLKETVITGWVYEVETGKANRLMQELFTDISVKVIYRTVQRAGGGLYRVFDVFSTVYQLLDG